MKKLTLKKALIATVVLVLGCMPLQARANVVPSAPIISQLGPLSTAAINITFQSPDSGGETITSYDIWVSDDHGITYNFHGTGTPSGTSLQRFGIAASAAIARVVKVRARTATTEGMWSQPVEMFTTGARPMRVFIQAPDGTPIIGGAVSWDMPQTPSGGKAHSSVTYGLSTDGYIDLPQAPAGGATFTLVNGQLPNGVLVSGSIGAVLGYPTTKLNIVRPPSALHVVSVEMPNGLPIANASVEVNSTDMTDTQVRQGFTFKLPDSGLLSATPDYGPVVSPTPIPAASESASPSASATQTSSPKPTPTVTVTVTASPTPTDEEQTYGDEYDWGSDVIDPANYEDDYWDYDELDYDWSDWAQNIKSPNYFSNRSANSGHKSNVVVEGKVVASGKTNAMGRFVVKGFTNTVPTATISYDDGVISQSETVQLQAPLTRVELSYAPFLSAGSAEYDSSLTDPAIIPVAVAEIVDSQRMSLLALKRQSAQVRPQKARFKIIAPAGSKKATCKKTSSSFSTGSNGKTTIKVCASVSGNYLIKSLTPGVQSLGAFLIRVKGAPPMAVRKLVGKSKKPGSIALKWTAPKYSGGSKVISYEVTVKKGGRIVLKRTFTKASGTIDGLDHAKRYEVSVVAVTKFGIGAVSQILVPVV